jgi:hypothetical protein
VSGPLNAEPASLADLSGAVDAARRHSPLQVPAGITAKFAASGATLTEARSQLFGMITSGAEPTVRPGAVVLNMQEQR